MYCHFDRRLWAFQAGRLYLGWWWLLSAWETTFHAGDCCKWYVSVGPVSISMAPEESRRG